MSDFGLFEASAIEDDAPQQRAKQASRQLQAAIYDVHQTYGPFLLASSGKDEFEDRWHYSKKDIRKTIEPHLLPVTGVMRRVHDALKREYKQRLADGASASGTVSAPDSVRYTIGDNDQSGIAGGINVGQNSALQSGLDTAADIGHSLLFPGKQGRRQADKTGPDQHLQQTDYHSDDILVPESGRGAFENYKDSVDQNAPEKVQHNFERTDANDWDKTREGRVTLDLYTDWARSNNLRVASVDTLELYSPNCSPGEFRLIDAAIRQAGETPPQFEKGDEEEHEEAEERDESDDDDEDEDDSDEDEGDDEGDEDEEDDDSDEDDSDDGKPWHEGRRRYAGDNSYEGHSEGKCDGDCPWEGDEGTGEFSHDKGKKGGGRKDSRRRYAAEEDDQDSGGGGQPAPDPSQQQAPPDPSQGGGAPPMDPSQMGGAPPPDPSQGGAPPPLENQPAEDALLDTASQAVQQMMQRETQEYQQIMGPLNQAVQAIQFAQQVEQQSHPLDVTPPQGTVDVGPQAAGPMAQQQPQQPQQMMGRRRQGSEQCRGCGGQDGEHKKSCSMVHEGSVLTHRAQRIASVHGMTRVGYQMVIEAMNDRHYQEIAEAVSILPPSRRMATAASLADLFKAENPHFRTGAFLNYADAIPRRVAGDPYTDPHSQDHGPITRGGPSIDDPTEGPTYQRVHPDIEQALRRRFETGGGSAWHPEKPDVILHGLNNFWDGPSEVKHLGGGELEYQNPWNGDTDRFNKDGYYDHGGNLKPWSSAVDDYRHEASRSRLGFNRGRQADAGSLQQRQVMDAWEPPGANQGSKVSDNIALTKDNMGNPKALKIKIKPKKAKSLEKAWQGFEKSRADQGLDTSDIVDMAAFKDKNPNRSEKSFADLGQKIGIPPTAPTVTKSPTGGGKMFKPPGGPKTIKAPGTSGGGSRKKGSFFTRRVDGWKWNDHLAAYTASAPNPFTCDCGTSVEVPSYNKCRCGKVYNSYVIGSPEGEGRTAAIDMFLCREIQERPGMMMEASHHTACSDPSCFCRGEDWHTDAEMEEQEAPHAPYKNASRLAAEAPWQPERASLPHREDQIARMDNGHHLVVWPSPQHERGWNYAVLNQNQDDWVDHGGYDTRANDNDDLIPTEEHAKQLAEHAHRKLFSPDTHWDPDETQDPFDPRLIGAGRIAGVPWNETKLPGLRQHERHDLDYQNWGGDEQPAPLHPDDQWARDMHTPTSYSTGPEGDYYGNGQEGEEHEWQPVEDWHHDLNQAVHEHLDSLDSRTRRNMEVQRGLGRQAGKKRYYTPDAQAEDDEWLEQYLTRRAPKPEWVTFNPETGETTPGRHAAIGEDDHTVVYRDGDRFCSRCDALLWDPNVHHCPVKQAYREAEMKSKEYRDDEPTAPPDKKPGDDDASTLTPHLQQRVKNREGTDGDKVEEHATEDNKKKSHRMVADWTKYDDDSEESPPHSSEMGPFTDDWAQRGGPDPRKPSSQWRGPTFQRRQRH